MRIPSVLFALALAGACTTGGASSPPTANRPPVPTRTQEMAEPSYLPLSARALLSDRMQHHGQAMSDIMWSVLFLDYEAASDIAREIEQEPRLSRPVRRDAAELNSLLPTAFFDLQDELAERARSLAEAAETEDPVRVSSALGELSSTCIRCHTAYLRDPPAE